MPKLKLSKGEMQQQRNKLSLYTRLLPSLDLKRRQLTMELQKTRLELLQLQQQLTAIERNIGTELPMLANQEISLNDLVRAEKVTIVEENLVGIKMPMLKSVSYQIIEYPRLATPAWIDMLAEKLQRASKHSIRIAISEQRVGLLEQAVRRITQRVNLFDKVLIPNAKDSIKKIRIFLGDLERDAVVRSKIAKSKRLQTHLGSAVNTTAREV